MKFLVVELGEAQTVVGVEERRHAKKGDNVGLVVDDEIDNEIIEIIRTELAESGTRILAEIVARNHGDLERAIGIIEDIFHLRYTLVFRAIPADIILPIKVGN